MSASEISLEAIDDALREIMLEQSILEMRVRRLLSEGFEDGERAWDRVREYMKHKGPEWAAEAISGNRQRSLIGYQRQPFLFFGASRNPSVKAALAALPGEVLKLGEAQKRVLDLEGARRHWVMTKSRSESQTERRKLTDTLTRSRGRSRSS